MKGNAFTCVSNNDALLVNKTKDTNQTEGFKEPFSFPSLCSFFSSKRTNNRTQGKACYWEGAIILGDITYCDDGYKMNERYR